MYFTNDLIYDITGFFCTYQTNKLDMLQNIVLCIANFGQSSLIVQSKVSHTNFTFNY